mmetsp:Transcript_2465/g.3702  ORF Transcript_2465/g.3702 Transcript_2465/m.3702 type:complete len:90 (-) Transcript_2465:1322-1591(-)
MTKTMTTWTKRRNISRLPAAAVEEAAEEDPLHPHPEKVVEEALHPNPHVEEDHPDDTTVEEEDVVVDPAHPEEWSRTESPKPRVLSHVD